MNYTWVVILLVIILGIIFYRKRIPSCDKCQIKMRLYKSEGDISMNITKTIRISFFKGFRERVLYTYKCNKCGSKKIIKEF
ncbi:MAG: hypothetical protein OCD02_18550 [Spirochaetaceae bacterium]